MTRKMQWLLTVMVAGIVAGSVVCLANAPQKGKKKILMFSQSFGFRHGCVTRPMTGELSHAERVFKEIATKAGYEVYLSQDFNDLNRGNQAGQFEAIVLYTTQSPKIDRDALLKWLQEGGALIGIHCATDSFYDWEDYNRFMGGYFDGHGPQQQEVHLKVEDTDHPATKMLGSEWVITDEIYHIKQFQRDKVHMLISVDLEATDDAVVKKQGFKPDRYYPVSWTNTEGKGRVFYTSLGHRDDVWTNPVWQEHLLNGIAWALKQTPESK